MAFGVYVHIPYCLQRCIYCDFATYESHQILPPSEYVARIKSEIAIKGPLIAERNINTVYFGGGTPSLIDPLLILDILNTLKGSGFNILPKAEITLEINPATLDQSKIDLLICGGVNRFSVGAQTFDDSLLKMAHRKHSAKDTRDTLSLLKSYGVNFSLDLLFSLPTQTVDGLKRDIAEALSYDPPHVSPYCLTVPESNPLAKNRACEDDQVLMFEVLREALEDDGCLKRYEISNFSKPGFESRHNQIYWEDQPYWGIGLSSHSYLKNSKWGVRFWNPRNINDYINEIDGMKAGDWSPDTLPTTCAEYLKENQALTDYFHTSLRTKQGVNSVFFKEKFKKDLFQVAKDELIHLMDRGLLENHSDCFRLTEEGILLSNTVFRKTHISFWDALTKAAMKSDSWKSKR